MKLNVDIYEMLANMGRAKISQRSLAERTGLHPNTISNVLHGRTSPTLEMLGAIVKGLNEALEEERQPAVSPFDLMIAEGFPAPQMDAPIPA